MPIRILAIGKKHESWVQEGISRYETRLKRPFNVEWVLLPHSSREGVQAREEESEGGGGEAGGTARPPHERAPIDTRSSLTTHGCLRWAVTRFPWAGHTPDAGSGSFTSGHGSRDPDPSPPDSHNGLLGQLTRVIHWQPFHEQDAALSGHIGQPDQPMMPSARLEDELPKVLVHRHEDPVLCRRPSELSIARISTSLAGLDDIVAATAQPVSKTPPDAYVYEESHLGPTRTASSESWAMTACA